MTEFLEETKIIDYSNPEILTLAKRLSTDCKTDVEIAKMHISEHPDTSAV